MKSPNNPGRPTQQHIKNGSTKPRPTTPRPTPPAGQTGK